jgi:DNA polymerase I-like protein with 3'-5' exonuclease and polymerase domains
MLGQNYLYDMQFFMRYFAVKPNLKYDTMVGWHVCFPGERKSLDFISSMLCEKYVYWKDELKDYKNLPEDEEEFWTYNCKDIVYTSENWEKISQMITHYNLDEQYQFLIDIHDPLISAMLRGIKINKELKSSMSLDVMSMQMEYHKFFESIMPGYFPSPKSKSRWYDSSHQLKKLLYEDLGLPKQWNRKGGKSTVTTDNEALNKLIKKEPLIKPLAVKLQEYRSLGVFQNNFLSTKLEADSRIRCSFKIAGPETFRLASSEDVFGYGTNLQNLPKGNIVEEVTKDES